MKNLNLSFLIFICVNVMAQDNLPGIYNPETPYVHNLWHRVGDYSPGLRSVESAELSADSRLVVSGAKFGYAVMLWRTADGELLWEKEHESEVECVTFSPDASKIATGGEDYFVRIWKTENGKELKKLEHPNGLDGIAWSNDGKLIAAGTEGGDLYMWDANNYNLIGNVNVGSTINSIQFTKDDKRVVVGGNIQYNDPESGERIYDGFAKLIKVDGLETLVEYKGPNGSVKSVRMTDDEKYVATGGFDRKARLFDLESGELIKTFYEDERIEAVAFTPDGNFLLTGGIGYNINIYRLSDFKLVHEMKTPRTEYIDFSDDGRLMLTGHEDSGLLSLYLMVSDTQRIPGLYNKVANQQLDNRDLKE